MSERWTVHQGDALALLRAMETHSVDAVVCDPPAGIGFMNAEWDKDKGGRDSWIAWLAEIFTEVRRVAKPGAHALVWSLPRTSHWTAFGVENAEWVLRDQLLHLFATGFPKNHRIDLALDKAAGAEREIGGLTNTKCSYFPGECLGHGRSENDPLGVTKHALPSLPATAAPQQWQGWGSALKPSAENWWLARAPLSEDTLAANVVRWGTGALHIDACRIGYASDEDMAAAAAAAAQRACRDQNENRLGYGRFEDGPGSLAGFYEKQALGRWPAHLLLSHAEECEKIGTVKVRGHKGYPGGPGGSSSQLTQRGMKSTRTEAWAGHADVDGAETVEEWRCVDGCPVRLLDEQSGDRPGMSGGGAHKPGYAGGMFGGIDSPGTSRGDSGGASRFFFCAKPTTAERELGLEDFIPRRVNDGRETEIDNPYQRGETQRKNIHTTVKSVALMRWLVRLITPPGGLVLDPFAGSGTTGIAAMLEGHRFVGCELDEEHARIARARIGFAATNPKAFDPEARRTAKKPDERQMGLFGFGGVPK